MAKSKTSDGVAVKIDRETYDHIKDYALMNGKNVQQVVNAGLEFWFDIWAKTESEDTLEKIAKAAAIKGLD